jgi:hypothetical protein
MTRHWRTSSYTAGNGACVEVATQPCEVLIRDTKNRAGGMLSVGHAEWRALLQATRTAEIGRCATV